jgi:hypothetical protein
MGQYINTNKEFYWGDWYFKSHVMCDGFDYKAHKKELSAYYESRGFKVSMMFDDYFSTLNGIHSDRYLSMDVYYFFVIPSLNRHDFKDAYLDKNIYSDLFPNVRQPHAVVKNIHGHFYRDGEEITLEQALAAILSHEGELIIKPTVETCNGEGVEQLAHQSREQLKAILEQYGINYIVQEKVKQHPDLQCVNPTSLNSMRLYTYRRLDGSYKFLYPYAHMRFGGKGAIKDNVSQGGGTCLIHPDGLVDDKVYRFKDMHVGSLKEETGVEGLVIPSYENVIQALFKMHSRLPYFDFVGWDVTVLPDGEPLLIEFNLVPSVEGPQMMAGPMFGEYLDEVIERARQVECSREQCYKKVFAKDTVFYLHMQ